MSPSRFAPVTSDLLARKGDAMPSTIAAKPSLFWRREPLPPPPVDAPRAEPARVEAQRVETPRAEKGPLPPEPPPPTEAVKQHKMVVSLSQAEFERLGIAAVKKGVTRHQVVRTALDLHLERLRREYGGCGCLALDASCPPGGCGGA